MEGASFFLGGRGAARFASSRLGNPEDMGVKSKGRVEEKKDPVGYNVHFLNSHFLQIYCFLLYGDPL